MKTALFAINLLLSVAVPALPAHGAVEPGATMLERRDFCEIRLAQIEFSGRHVERYHAWRQAGAVILATGDAWAEFWCDGGALYRADSN